MNVKMVCVWFVVLSLAVVGCTSTEQSPLSANSTVPGRVLVPGGTKKELLDKLWKTAKSKCFEIGYIVANDDRETGNILCTKNVEKGNYTILVNFNSEGFSVTTKGVLAGAGFFEMLDPMPKQRKREMEDALKQAAGIKG